MNRTAEIIPFPVERMERVGKERLDRSLDDYHGRLGTAKHGVDVLNAEAHQLESWADGVLAR